MTPLPASVRPPTDPDRPAAPGPDRLPAWVGAAARWLAAPLGGVLLYAACAPRTLWWLAPLGFALLGAALRGRRPRTGFALGLLFGLGFFVPLLPWIGIYVGPLPWLVLALLEALFLAAGAAAIAVVTRPRAVGGADRGRAPGSAPDGVPGGVGRGRAPSSAPDGIMAPVWAAAVWVATEAAAARVPFGGFPWGKVAYSQADGPFARLAAIGGTPLVSFAVVLTGFGLAALARVLARRLPGEAGRRSALVATCCAVLPLLAAISAPAWLTGSAGSAAPTPSDRTVTVAAIQGSVPRLGLDFNAQRRAVLDNHVKRTLQLAEDVRSGRVPRPDLVIWPENSSDIDPLRNADAYREISAAAHDVGRPILVGAVLVQPDGKHTTNSALVWDPVAGPVQRNDKRRVQPFGEYLPWRGFFRLFSEYADRAGFFEPGTGPGVVTLNQVPVGVAICWEVAFDDLVNDSVRNGAQLLAVPTNNATFGRSEMTFQQLAMSRLRAVEHDRSVLVAATSGVSAIIAPDGGVQARSALFAPAALVERVPLRTTTTLATRLGAIPEWLLVALGVAALAAAVAGRGRRAAARPGRQPETSREDEDD